MRLVFTYQHSWNQGRSTSPLSRPDTTALLLNLNNREILRSWPIPTWKPDKQWLESKSVLVTKKLVERLVQQKGALTIQALVIAMEGVMTKCASCSPTNIAGIVVDPPPPYPVQTPPPCYSTLTITKFWDLVLSTLEKLLKRKLESQSVFVIIKPVSIKSMQCCTFVLVTTNTFFENYF